jgi:outer membrane protein OmpA-like peptidoglycan-associated protein
MQFIKKRVLSLVLAISAVLGFAVVPAQAMAPQITFTEQIDMGTVKSAVSIGVGVAAKVFAINGDSAVVMETPVSGLGTQDTLVDTDGCTAVDISLDATYLWALCADMTGRRIVLSSITTINEAANTIDSFNINSVSNTNDPTCHLSEIYSDGTYIGVSDNDGTAHQGSATFAHGTTPTLDDIGSMSFPLFSCRQDLIRPLVVGSTTYNIYFEKATGAFTTVSMEDQWAQVNARTVYNSSNQFDSVSVGGGQLWAHPTSTSTALHYDPSNLSKAPTATDLSTNQIKGIAFDGFNIWSGYTFGPGLADARNATSGAVVAWTDLPSPSLVVRWGTLTYAIAGTKWYSATMSINASTPPSRPQAVSVAVNNGIATITWKAPIDHGSAAISKYTGELMYGANQTAGRCEVVVLHCTIDVSRLPVATFLMARVTATSSAGNSTVAHATQMGVTGDLVVFPDTSGKLAASQTAALRTWMKDICGATTCLDYSFNVTGYTDTSVSGASATQQSNARATVVVNFLTSLIPASAKKKPKFFAVSGGATTMWDKKNPAGNRRVWISLRPM